MYRFSNLRELINLGPGDGGGGGGTGDDDKPPTKEEIKQMISEGVNGAVKSHLGRVDFGGMITTAIGGQLTEMKGDITKLMESVTNPGGKKPGEGGKGGEGEGDEKYNEIMKKLDEERTARVAAEGEREADRLTARRSEERQVLSAELTKNNIRPELLQGAIAVLDSENEKSRMVGRDKEGNIMWKTGDPLTPFKAMAEGVKEWATGDDGKPWLKPRDVGGSGNKGGSAGSSGGSGDEPSDSDVDNYLLGR